MPKKSFPPPRHPTPIQPNQDFPKPQEQKPPSIQDTLDERGTRYGNFEDHAQIAQRLQDIFRSTPNWTGDLAKGIHPMEDDAKQALTTIADKIARILNGDPNYDDNWRDISGYATLILNRILKEQSK